MIKHFKNLMILAALISLPAFATANPGNDCDTTDKMTDIQKKIDTNAASEQDLKAGHDLLQYFKFCPDKDALKKQIPAVVSLSVRMIQKDVTGDSDAYFYDIYNERKAEMKSAVAQLPAAQQKQVNDSLANTAYIWKHGNGAAKSP